MHRDEVRIDRATWPNFLIYNRINIYNGSRFARCGYRVQCRSIYAGDFILFYFFASPAFPSSVRIGSTRSHGVNFQPKGRNIHGSLKSDNPIFYLPSWVALCQTVTQNTNPPKPSCIAARARTPRLKEVPVHLAQ